MTGFSADWLALREPADHRARNAQLRARVVARLAAIDSPAIVDLGCGSGSNLRALAPCLGPRQRWTLVDHDPPLLDAARDALALWADNARIFDGGLTLRRDGREIEVVFRRADLASGVAPLLEPRPDLVTAAALFDLAGVDWINAFVADLVGRSVPLYAVLTYDGVERWAPPHADDAAILAAFHAHQRSDKGLGTAAGPEATMALRTAFTAAGWSVEIADSPWALAAIDAALMNALASGAADAVAETGLVAPDAVARWRAARVAPTSCVVGHKDLFATPAI